MTLKIDFTPQEADWLNAQAQQQGVPPAEIIRKMVDAHLYDTAAQPGLAATVTAHLTPTIDTESEAALAQLHTWLKEDATNDPEEIRRSEEEYEELKRNLNANRAATGERLVFP